MKICWTGENAQEIAAAVSCRDDLKPYELTSKVSLRQRDGDFFLTLPARHGEVWLAKGDWAVREADGGWVRLNPDQFRMEYPQCLEEAD